jgi:hypothetical protein
MPVLLSVAAARFSLVILLVSSSALQAQATYTPIEQRLSADQMHATGIARLTPAELSELNRILSEQHSARPDTERTVRFGFRGASAPPIEQPDAPQQIETTIAGDFRGWASGTVITLTNGQVWRVTEGSLQTKRTADPKATITRSGMGSHFLKVDGYNARAKVTRVR